MYVDATCVPLMYPGALNVNLTCVPHGYIGEVHLICTTLTRLHMAVWVMSCIKWYTMGHVGILLLFEWVVLKRTWGVNPDLV